MPVLLKSLTVLCVDVTAAFFFFFFNDTATTEIYTLSLHDALPIYQPLNAALPSSRQFLLKQMLQKDPQRPILSVGQ